MTDYISREAAVLSLLNKGQHSRRYKLGEIWELDFEEIREAIKSVPAADVREVIRGKWLFDDFDGDGLDYQCTCCGGYSRSNYDFCPNCGADMRETNNEI